MRRLYVCIMAEHKFGQASTTEKHRTIVYIGGSDYGKRTGCGIYVPLIDLHYTSSVISSKADIHMGELYAIVTALNYIPDNVCFVVGSEYIYTTATHNYEMWKRKKYFYYYAKLWNKIMALTKGKNVTIIYEHNSEAIEEAYILADQASIEE